MQITRFKITADGNEFIPDPSVAELTCPAANKELVFRAARLIGYVDGLLFSGRAKVATIEIIGYGLSGEQKLFIQDLFVTTMHHLRISEATSGVKFDTSEPFKLHMSKSA